MKTSFWRVIIAYKFQSERGGGAHVPPAPMGLEYHKNARAKNTHLPLCFWEFQPQSSQVDLLTSYRELAIGMPSHAPPNATENLVWTKAGYKERQK